MWLFSDNPSYQETIGSLPERNKTIEEKQVSEVSTLWVTKSWQHKQHASVFCFDAVGNHCKLNGGHSKFKSNMEVNKNSIWAHINISNFCEAVSEWHRNNAT